MLLLLQAAPPAVSGWVGPTIAISVALMALAWVIVFAAAAVAAIALKKRLDIMSDNLGGLREDLAGMVEGARRVAEQGETIVGMVRDEGEAYLATSKRFRRRLERGIDRMSERMSDLDALYEVVHEEVEESALRFASALRTTRLSTGIIAKVLRRRRRR